MSYFEYLNPIINEIQKYFCRTEKKAIIINEEM